MYAMSRVASSEKIRSNSLLEEKKKKVGIFGKAFSKETTSMVSEDGLGVLISITSGSGSLEDGTDKESMWMETPSKKVDGRNTPSKETTEKS